jgi:hypothetical protein
MLKPLAFLSLILLFSLVSCHKNNTGPGDSSQLVGNYKFLYLSASTQETNTESAAGQNIRTVTFTNYKTTSNTGTVAFTKDSLSSKNVGYTANTNANVYIYTNNSLTDSLQMPFSETVPPTSSTAKYDVIGKDSIYFHGGSIFGLSAGATATVPSGGRFSFKGDTLLITMKISQNLPPQNQGGVTITGTVAIQGVIAMQKQ